MKGRIVWTEERRTTVKSGQQKHWPKTGLVSSIVFYAELSRTSSMHQFQIVKSDTMQQAIRGETPACLGQSEWGLISNLYIQKTQNKCQDFSATEA